MALNKPAGQPSNVNQGERVWTPKICMTHKGSGQSDESPWPASERISCLPVQQASHRVCGLLVLRVEDVSVDIAGDADGRMAEDGGHHLERGTRRQHQACRAVSKLMWMPLADLRLQAVGLQLLRHVPRVEGRPHASREHIAGVSPCH